MENGYTLSWKDELEEGKLVDRSLVVEENDWDESSEAKAAHDLLWEVLEYFGVFGSKHDRVRPRVKLEHGDNYECKGCEVCKDE